MPYVRVEVSRLASGRPHAVSGNNAAWEAGGGDRVRASFPQARRVGAGLPAKSRIALYSHDTMGLGHVRRNLLVAKALAASEMQPTMLMLAGAREAGAFAIPAGVDCVTLPSLRKEPGGSYRSRHLDLSVHQLIRMRASILRAALEAFEPDLLIVDNTARGAVRELDPALASLRSRGHTRCVLGLRDVRDDPEVVRREWLRDANAEAVRDFYDQIWVYGDPRVYDLVEECAFCPLVADKVRYTGYLDQRDRLNGNACEGMDPIAGLTSEGGRMVLCMVGGGQDGGRLAEAFADTRLPRDCRGILLTGPFMPEATKRSVRARAALNPQLKVLDFVPEPTPLLEHADRVITMGGYNSVCEVLSFEKRALIVPRVSPRIEQWIRAERLQKLGLADMLHPGEVSPQALGAWVARDVPPPRARSRINLNGLAALPHLAGRLLEHQMTREIPG